MSDSIISIWNMEMYQPPDVPWRMGTAKSIFELHEAHLMS